jgi:pyrimidine operon attenuation protein/uracil phosphoribosyltransferase
MEIIASDNLELKVDDLIKALFNKIDADNNITNLAFLGIKSRGDIIGKKIIDLFNKKYHTNFVLNTLRVSFYKDDLTILSPQPIISEIDIKQDLNNKTLIIIDDVFYSGKSTAVAIAHLKQQFAVNIKIATLVERPGNLSAHKLSYHGLFLDLDEKQYVKVSLLEKEGHNSIIIYRR